MRLRTVALVLLVALAAAGALVGPAQESLEIGEDWDAAYEAAETFELDRAAGLLAVFADVDRPGLDESVRLIEEALEALPVVEELVTPFDIPGIETLAEARSHPVASRTVALERGLLLAAVPPVNSEVPINFTDWCKALPAAARLALAEHDPTLEVGLTGKWPIVHAQQTVYGEERVRFLILGTLLGFALASFTFRTVRATFLAGLPPILGVGLAVGVARLVGLGNSSLTQLVLPLLVLTIGFTDSLHVVVAAVRARRSGAPSGGAAVDIATRELLAPCALTSLTTAIGFGSLATAGSEVAVDFGLTCALATLLCFAAVFLTLPILCRTPLGARLADIRIGEEKGAAPRARAVVARGLDVALARPVVTALVAVLLTATCGWLASQLGHDRRVTSDLADGDEAAAVLQRVDRELGGVLPLHVRIDWDEGVVASEVQRIAGEVSRRLEEEPLVGGAIGPAELAASVGGSWAALSLLPEAWRTPFLRPEARTALVHARIPDEGSRALAEAFVSLDEGLAALEAPGVRLSLVGQHYAYLRTVGSVTAELARSLGIAAVLILLTLGLAFRSWRMGVASAVPNLLPIGASAAGLHLTGQSIDISILTALTLSLGIATDDSIHVLSRWRRERAAGAPAPLAARQAVLKSYPALAVTTLTLGATFALLLTSALPAIRGFGLVAATTLLVAFLADVWLLPALLVVVERRGRSEPGVSSRRSPR